MAQNNNRRIQKKQSSPDADLHVSYSICAKPFNSTQQCKLTRRSCVVQDNAYSITIVKYTKCKRHPMPIYMFRTLPGQNLSTRNNNANSPEDHVWPQGLISLRDSGAIAVLPTSYNGTLYGKHTVFPTFYKAVVLSWIVPRDSSIGAQTLTGMGATFCYIDMQRLQS